MLVFLGKKSCLSYSEIGAEMHSCLELKMQAIFTESLTDRPKEHASTGTKSSRIWTKNNRSFLVGRLNIINQYMFIVYLSYIC